MYLVIDLSLNRFHLLAKGYILYALMTSYSISLIRFVLYYISDVIVARQLYELNFDLPEKKKLRLT
jgi:hypothetical protein